MLNPEKPVRFSRLCVGDSMDNWWGGLTQAESPVEYEKCFGFWLNEAEALAFYSWLNSFPETDDKFVAYGDDWYEGPLSNPVREIPKILVNGVLSYDVSVSGMMFCEFEMTLEAALNTLKGYCRDIPGWNVRDIDWWIDTFGAEALAAFYSEVKARGENEGVKYLDELLLALVK